MLRNLSKPAQPEETPASDGAVVSLAERAIAYLQQAATAPPEQADLFVEERAIWRPDSWLLQCIWQALAGGGAARESLLTAALLQARAPMARAQALYRLAQYATGGGAGEGAGDPPQDGAYVMGVVRETLRQQRHELLRPIAPGSELDSGTAPQQAEMKQIEKLLLVGASAALVDERELALSAIERADQIPHVWERVIAHTAQRGYLAQIVAQVGLHPLTAQLVGTAVWRFEEAGAHFLHQVASHLGPRVARKELPRHHARLLQCCVETFQYATLVSLTSRRLAAAVFGQAGMTEAVLEQISTIGNVQEARRESGLDRGHSDPNFLRQVKRPTANADVDFQVYALREAIRMMPVRTLPREERIALADRLAGLAIRSDGWTAAGAAASLIELGALKYAVDVVDHIEARDTTRSEGVISLVRALLRLGEPRLAAEQVEKALQWLQSLDTRNPERATIWGLAELYLEFDRPEMALHLLDQRIKPPTLGERVRRTFQNRPNDDELRDNRLRFRAYIQDGRPWDKELQALYDQLCQWAPRLLDGEALIGFYVEGLLRPLLAGGRADLVWPLLPQIREALNTGSGDKHAKQIRRVTSLLANWVIADEGPPDETLHPAHNGADASSQPEEFNQSAVTTNPDVSTAPNVSTNNVTTAYQALNGFMLALWEADVQKGLWQTVHGIEGSLALLLALEGPSALQLVAQMAAREGHDWGN